MNSMATPPAREGLGSGTVVVKRRACDECRSRKLACTKEPKGCARCSREGVACFYSTQKRMGRPKKIRNDEKTPGITPTAPVALTSAPVTVQDDQSMTIPDATKDAGPGPFLDPSLIAEDTSFLDLFAPDFISTDSYQTPLPDLKDNPLSQAWNFDINFDHHDPQQPADSAGIDPVGLTPVGLNTPSLSSQGASPADEAQQPPEHTHTAAPLPPDSCSCLANLYLALDSLTHLPAEVGSAIRVSRNASKTAHETVQCQVCSPPLGEAMTVPMTAYRNMLMLGALLPSIADAYHRILEMADAETAAAVRARRQLRFTLPGYGGIWGRLGASEQLCGATERYADVALEPATWRLTVRAMLKMDIYGIHADPGGPVAGNLPGGASHLGLRDIVTLMDDKSRARHAEVDALIDAGLVMPGGPACTAARHTREAAGGEPHCRRIIQIAKEAVDGLVVA